MNLLIRFALGLAALAAAVSAAADDLQVDMVVNLTDAGRKIARPDAAHPVYYYPISKGYNQGGQVLNNMAQPPEEWDVLHTIGKALYTQGYRMAAADHEPELLLLFWWGYKAPVILNNGGNLNSPMGGGGFVSPHTMAAEGGGSGGGIGFASSPMDELMLSGRVSSDATANPTEMETLVMGSQYETDFSGSTTLRNLPDLRLERLRNAARDPRYYVMISALDFNQALKSKFVVYWTARVSTPIYDHTLAEVIPTLVADVAPSLGRDTGPQITDKPLVPVGHVIVGTPTLVTAHPNSAK